MTAMDNVALLRLYISDPKNGTEIFSDSNLESHLDSAVDTHAAAAELWSIKAATVHDWYLSQTDGSLLSRDQVFDHCMAMAKYHEDHSSAQIVSVAMDSGGGGYSTQASFEM